MHASAIWRGLWATVLASQLLAASTVDPVEPASEAALADRLRAMIPAEFRLPHKEIAPEDDMAVAWQEAQTRFLPLADDALLDTYAQIRNRDRPLPDPQQQVRIEAWLDSNAGALDLLIASLERPALRRPTRGGRPSVSMLRDAARMLTARSRLAAERGELARAWRDARSILRFAQRLRAAGGTTLDNLVAASLAGIALPHLRAILADPALDTSDLATMARDLMNLEQAWPESHTQQLRSLLSDELVHLLASTPTDGPAYTRHRGMTHAQLERLAEQTEIGEVPGNPFILRFARAEQVLDPAATMRLAGEFAQDLARRLERPWPALRAWLTEPDGIIAAHLRRVGPATEAIDPLRGMFEALLDQDAGDPAPTIAHMERLFTESDNIVGLVLVATFFDPRAWELAIATDLRALAKLRLLRLWAALRVAGLRDQSITAPTLPDDLGAWPQDPFGHGPIRYDPERRLLWSVGADAVDHDGRYQDREWDRRAADLVLELPAICGAATPTSPPTAARP